MTRKTSARLAGFMFLFYIAVAFPSMVLIDRATSATGTAAKLARIGEYASDVRLTVLLSLITCFVAPILAVVLYGITRDEDQELAVLALSCRVGEGVLSAIYVIATLGLLWLETSPGAPQGAAGYALGAFLLKVQSWNMIIGATFFAAGSTLYSYLFLRARTIPLPLAWLGVIASGLLVFVLPAQLAGFIKGPPDLFLWTPMLVFEVTLGLWLLIKGVGAPATRIIQLSTQ